MVENCKPPSELRFTGNLGEDWRKLEQNIWLYLTVTKARDELKNYKIAAVLKTSNGIRNI